jgi:hypothetical protein
MDPTEEEVDIVVEVEERHDFIPWSVVALFVSAALIFSAIMCWLAISLNKADEVTNQWRIWSVRCEQIVHVNAESIRLGKDAPAYLDGCPEGPRNEPVTINR